jgi:chloramphenicol 3-O-phosphotransferase
MGIGVGLFSRHAEHMAAEALADTRVVVVNGARQVGKSTLAELIVARSAGARELYLDDQAVRAAAQADPSAFVRHDGLLVAGRPGVAVVHVSKLGQPSGT